MLAYSLVALSFRQIPRSYGIDSVKCVGSTLCLMSARATEGYNGDRLLLSNP